MERYEITLDVDDDVPMTDDAYNSGHNGRGTNGTNMTTLNHSITTLHQLQSTVTKRRGRGFSEGRAHDSILVNDRLTSAHHGHLPSGEALPERSVEGWTVFLSGLHEETTEDAFLDFLTDSIPATIGVHPVREVKVAMDHRTGYAKGYGMVECREYREARAVIDAVDGRPFLGVPVRADFAFIRPQASSQVRMT